MVNKINLKTKNKNQRINKMNTKATKNKKAQMKIQQTAFMLMAITLLFVLVGLFFVSFKSSDLKQSANDLEEKNAMILASKLSNSPEFSCEEAFGSKRINCIDSDKLIGLIQNKNRYGSFWGVLNIEVRKIYPVQANEIPCTLGNYPDCNIYDVLSRGSGTDYSSFVILCRKESLAGELYNKCEFAKLIISYEKKQ